MIARLDPEWDAKTTEQIEYCDGLMRDNLAGVVRQIYNIGHGTKDWVYGHQHWPLTMEPDDPLRGRASCTLAEFRDYLKR